jgi:hypothetical protein
MGTVYHREPLMDYHRVSIGYGTAISYRDMRSVINSHRDRQRRPTERFIYTYPLDGQMDVPISWDGDERPDPLPGKTRPVGSVITLMIAQPERAGDEWNLDRATLTHYDGTNVPIYTLHAGNDPNKTNEPDSVHLIPQQILETSTTYTAAVTGTDSLGDPFDYTWSFTTMGAGGVDEIRATIGATGAIIRWETPLTITGRVEYGLTDSYGMQEAPYTQFFYQEKIRSRVLLTGLQPGTTYHYRIVTEDAWGTLVHTSDRTFTTDIEPWTLRVPEDVPDLPTAADGARPGDTIAIAAGTYTLTERLRPNAGVYLRGAGQGQTILRADHDGTLMTLRTGTHLSGLTLEGNGENRAIWIPETADVVIRDVSITGFDEGIESEGHPTIVQSVFTNNRESIDIFSGQAQIINNTLVEGERGIDLEAPGSTVVNNSIVNQSKDGIRFPDAKTFTGGYNSFWNNSQDMSIWLGEGNVTTDPRFTNPTTGDYTLQSDSPLRDAGHPDEQHNDADGSRNDIGATGSPQFVAGLLPEVPEPPELPTPEPGEILLPTNVVETDSTVFLPLVTR